MKERKIRYQIKQINKYVYRQENYDSNIDKLFLIMMMIIIIIIMNLCRMVDRRKLFNFISSRGPPLSEIHTVVNL